MSRPISTSRNEQLDGLRGYAAIAVAVFHSILGMDPTLVPRVVRANLAALSGWDDFFAQVILDATSGETAVCIFFTLSGVVLFDSLKRDGKPLPRLIFEFVVRRIFRIYPALIVCLIISGGVLIALGVPITFEDFSKNIALYKFALNGVTWTLNVEMVAIPFLLASFQCYRLGGERALVAAALIFYVLLRAPWPHAITLTFKFYWIYFALGMLITTSYGRWLAERLPAWTWIPALLVVVFSSSVPQQFAIALLVLELYCGRAGSLETFLRLPASLFLGRVSYSFYLFNVIFLSIVGHFLAPMSLAKDNPIGVGLLASVVVILFTLPIAHLSVRYIEMPGIRLGGYILGRCRATGAQERMAAPT
jgi:peptidoglycan/LPS O-acetylase OafA/YrhL